MQSRTDAADRTGTLGVEAFDATYYGAGFQAPDDSPHAVESGLVEDGGAFVAHWPTDVDRPRRVAFVDGTLTHRGAADPHRTRRRHEHGPGVDGPDVEAARQQLQRLRDAEADIAEVLSNEGWLTVLDDAFSDAGLAAGS